MTDEPVPMGSSLQAPRPPPRPERVYVNRNLRMDSIRAIGFDMDYTLARYVRQRLEELAHRLTLKKLVARGYPDDIAKFTYDPAFVIRGLTVDKQLGNILKLDRHNHPGRVFHGRRPLTQEERRALYRREKIRFVPPRFALVDTLFSLPEVCLYADLVDYFDARQPGAVDYWKLFDDTRECIDEAHRDDTLKSVVTADLATYVDRDPNLARTLHKLRSSGKKLFVITNSMWDYTDALMSYLLDGQLSEYASWQSYFEAVVVGAAKPLFFTGQAPLIALDANGQPTGKPVVKLTRGAVYQGGNLKDFEKGINIFGEEILYVGDHIYGDILRSKKTSLWRTAVIVEELEDEIGISIRHQAEVGRLVDLEKERQRLDNLLNQQRQHLSALERSLGEAARTAPRFEVLKVERDKTKAALKALVEEMFRLENKVSEAFNPNWGMVFKEERENSRFGEQVADYACVYTSRVSNFLHYSSYQYFRSPRDLLPHERE
jgi:5'-nucleotidase